METIDEYNSEWYSKWHEIDPDKSNYINFHQYCEIGDMLAIAAERILRRSNDSLKNHMLFTHIIQGPEYEYTTGSRFTKWLKKKLSGSKPPEILRITLDDKYFTDVVMDVFIDIPKIYWDDMVVVPQLQRLIKKLKEETK